MPTHSRGPRLADLAATVVGYGLAALLFRAIWRGSLEGSIGLVAAMVYAWFGLAMSGPILLFLDRRTLFASKKNPPFIKPRRVSEPETWIPTSEPLTNPLTRSEQAWIMIGAYCLMMTLVLVPARLGESPLGIVAVLQLITGFVLFFLGPRRFRTDSNRLPWTHTAAQVVLIGWPFAWIGLILLLKT